MKYGELIEKYENGELDAESFEEVERDIEKHESISEYLARREDIPELKELAGPKEQGGADSSREFVKKVDRRIRLAFVKAGAIVAALALAVILFVEFALPRIAERAYYDPTEIVYSDENGVEVNRMSADISVFSELFLPTGFREQVEAVSLGYGRYSLFIQQNHSLSGVFRDTAGMLDRGRLTLYDPNLFKFPVMNAFQPHRAGVKAAGNGRIDPEFSLEQLIGEMSETERRVVYVTFKQPMSYSDTLYWCEAVSGVAPLWGAACSGNETKLPVFYGAHIMPYGFVRGDNVENYPYLFATSARMTEDNMRQHIVSMLTYAADNEEAMKLLTRGEWDAEFSAACRETAADIERNGVMFYGVVFTANAETIREIYVHGDYSAIWVEPLE